MPPGRRTNPDFNDNVTYSHRLGFDPNENLSFNWFARSTYSKLRFTGEDFATSSRAFRSELQSAQGINQLATRGEAIWTLFDGRFKNYFGVNYTDHRTSRFGPDLGFGAFTALDKGERVKYDWRGVATVMPGQVVVFGLERERESFNAKSDFGGFGSASAASNGNTGAFVELQSNYQERVFLVANLRHDINDQFGPHTTYRIAPAVIVPETETKLKGSYGTGFKAPTLTQMFVSLPPTFFGNPNLQPDEHRLRFQLRAAFVREPRARRRDLLPQRREGFHRPRHHRLSSRLRFHFAIRERPAVREPGRRVVRDGRHQRLLEGARRLHLYRSQRRGPVRAAAQAQAQAGATAIWTPTERLTIATTLIYLSGWRDISRGDSSLHIHQPGYTVSQYRPDYIVTQNVAAFRARRKPVQQRYIRCPERLPADQLRHLWPRPARSR